MAAMEAGEAAGGDRRGKQSAVMVMVTTEDFPDLNLRVDDHAEPLMELRRLLGIWRVEGRVAVGDGAFEGEPVGVDRYGRDRGGVDRARAGLAVSAMMTGPREEGCRSWMNARSLL